MKVLTYLHKEDATEHTIEIDKLDNFIEKAGMRKIGLRKIDTKGNKFSILKGVKNALKNKRIDVFEFNEMILSTEHSSATSIPN